MHSIFLVSQRSLSSPFFFSEQLSKRKVGENSTRLESKGATLPTERSRIRFVETKHRREKREKGFDEEEKIYDDGGLKHPANGTLDANRFLINEQARREDAGKGGRGFRNLISASRSRSSSLRHNNVRFPGSKAETRYVRYYHHVN